MAYWLKFCDIYTFPHVVHFDSWEHLLELLGPGGTDLAAVSARMAAENIRILAGLEVQWNRLLKRMFGGSAGVGGGGGGGGGGHFGVEPGGRQVPAEFDEAMRAAYGMAAIGAPYGMAEPLAAEEPPCDRLAAPELANANIKYQWQPPSPFKKKW